MAIKIGKLFAANKLVGSGSSDTLIGGLLNDILIGGAGADSLFGGAGFDTADYSSSSAGVHVDLQWGIGWFGDAQGDNLNSIEKVIGSAFDDTLIAADWGNNVFVGGKGADTLIGGLGEDTADYSTSSAGVTVDLATGKGTGGDAQGDTLISMEKVVGSAYNDTLIGDKGNNWFTGGAGSDVFVMSAGDDTITDFTPVNYTLLDFNDRPQTGAPISNGYAGLNWGNILSVGPDHPLYHPSGYENVGLGTPVALDSGGTGGTIAAAGADFSLKSAYMASAWLDNEIVTIQGWDDGTLKITQTVTLGVNRTLVNFVGFDSIDKIFFSGTGGTPHGYDAQTSGQIVWDDITLAFDSAGGADHIDVPVGTNIAALVASAVSNGKGGTILTHAEGTLELQGIASGSVSADWFI